VRELGGPIEATAGEDPGNGTVHDQLHAVAVVLYLVNPAIPGRGLLHQRGRLRGYERQTGLGGTEQPAPCRSKMARSCRARSDGRPSRSASAICSLRRRIWAAVLLRAETGAKVRCTSSIPGIWEVIRGIRVPQCIRVNAPPHMNEMELSSISYVSASHGVKPMASKPTRSKPTRRPTRRTSRQATTKKAIRPRQSSAKSASASKALRAVVDSPTAKSVVSRVLTAAAGAAAAVVLKNVGDEMSKKRTTKKGVKDIAKRTLTEAAGAATTAGLAVAGERVAAEVRSGLPQRRAAAETGGPAGSPKSRRSTRGTKRPRNAP
jgi:hypothetical protein